MWRLEMTYINSSTLTDSCGVPYERRFPLGKLVDFWFGRVYNRGTTQTEGCKMSAMELFEVGVYDALLGRKPCIPSYAWGNDVLVSKYMEGYRSIGS
jgi:hypothetical protein